MAMSVGSMLKALLPLPLFADANKGKSVTKTSTKRTKSTKTYARPTVAAARSRHALLARRLKQVVTTTTTTTTTVTYYDEDEPPRKKRKLTGKITDYLVPLPLAV